MFLGAYDELAYRFARVNVNEYYYYYYHYYYDKLDG